MRDLVDRRSGLPARPQDARHGRAGRRIVLACTISETLRNPWRSASQLHCRAGLAALAVGTAVLLGAGMPSFAAEDQTDGGTIDGTVVYRAGDKPWRYARYYVSDPKKGLLAEAVVSLRAKSLRGLFPPESCDQGFANDSFGDNLIPGPPPF